MGYALACLHINIINLACVPDPSFFAYGGLLSLENGIFSLRPFLKKIVLEIMFYTLEGLFVMIFPSLSNVCS